MATHSLDGLVRRLRRHAQVDEQDAAAVLALPFTTVVRDQFAAIVREGDEVEHCFVILSGWAERHRLDSEGGKQILAFYAPGDPLNLDHLFLQQADDDLRSLRTTQLAAIRLADLRGLMARRARLADALLKCFAVDASIFREWTVNVGQRDAEQRIAHLLCELQVRRNEGVDPAEALPLTQYNIAEATGLTSVHVNRTLKMLQAKGLVEPGRGGIKLCDWQRLRDLAGFDYRYLHLQAFRDQT